MGSSDIRLAVEDEDDGDDEDDDETAWGSWVTRLLRLTLVVVAGLAACLYAQARQQHARDEPGPADGPDPPDFRGGHWTGMTCVACVALGAILVMVLQDELKERPSLAGPVGDGEAEIDAAEARRCLYPGDTFESWMFESMAGGEARPVLVRLEGRSLSVWAAPAGPQPRVPRVAMWGESVSALRRAQAALTTRRVYSLSAVSLLPDDRDLPRPGRWSRRQPICVVAFEQPVTDSVLAPTSLADSCKDNATARTSLTASASYTDNGHALTSVTASASCTDASASALECVSPRRTTPGSATVLGVADSLASVTPPPIVVQTPSCSAVGSSFGNDQAEAKGPSIKSAHSESSDISNLALDGAEADNVEDAQERLLDHIVCRELGRLVEEEDDEVEQEAERLTAPSSGGGTTSTLLLLARTARQKEEWFWRLRRACNQADGDYQLDDYVAALQQCLALGPASGAEAALAGLNALACRLLFDASRCERWVALVQAHAQRRVDGMRLPGGGLVDRPRVSGFHCRPTTLALSGASRPRLDRHGLWVDLDVIFRGVVRLVLTTRLNLNNNDDPEQQHQENAGSWKFFKKIAESNRLFQSALAALANTDLVLTVELRALDGVLCAHVAPPPSDRLWLAFRAPPRLRLATTPRVGRRALRSALLRRLLERRLRAWSERAFVLPNMTCVTVPFMGYDPASAAQTDTRADV